ncbi:CRISPR-associated endoribonuclease Cas6 [Plantactinospora sp. WMMC1484]|uniref:CRISPR-associated endoribonuclease Cas6 n=1 Tax=Plantactinospora sp. WMMC1484 TaxID=3404122 RepID=UPI003BF564DE
MRLRIEVVTRASEIPWSVVLAPGRGIAYQLLAGSAPELGNRLHDGGLPPHGMVPFGYGTPVFPGAERRRGRYASGGTGVVEFGSPLPALVEAWALALRRTELLDWGGVALRVANVSAVSPPDFSEGRVRMRTVTPVVMKRSGVAPGSDERVWLLPDEPEFAACLQGNLARKVETLGLSGKVLLEGVTWVGPKRSFAVGGGAKPGAAVEVELSGDAEALRAVWSWGLGQANSAGFGWISA